MLHIYNKVPSKISTIMVAFDAGARAESNIYPAGTAHMLEHMIFKGTKKRDCLSITREIGYLGGDVNAFTSQEMVAFYISVPYENIEKAMEILSDIVFNSTFPEEEFEKEIEVVKEEELSTKDDVDSFIWNQFSKEFFSQRHSIPIIGTQESISQITRQKVLNFYNQFYNKDNVIVSLCSNYSSWTGKKLLKKYFGKSDGQIKHDVKIYEPEYKDNRMIKINRKEIEHAYVWMCYPSLPIADPDGLTEDLLLNILGQGMDSRLFVEAREKRGLCYHIDADVTTGRDYSAALITAATRKENKEKLISVIEEEVRKLKSNLVSKEELIRSKNKIRAHNYSVSERSFSLARFALSKEYYGLQSLSEIEKKINKITEYDICELANKLFNDNKRLILICEDE